VAIAVDATSVYWGNQCPSDGGPRSDVGLMKLTPK